MSELDISGSRNDSKDTVMRTLGEMSVGIPLKFSGMADESHVWADCKIEKAEHWSPIKRIHNLHLDLVLRLEGNRILLVEYETNPITFDHFVKYIRSGVSVLEKEYSALPLNSKYTDFPEIKLHIVAGQKIRNIDLSFSHSFFNIETSVFYHRHINAKEAFSEIESMVTAKETLTNRELTYLLILPMSGNIKSFDKTFFKDCYYLAQKAFFSADSVSANKELGKNYNLLAFNLYHYMLAPDEWYELLKEKEMVSILEEYQNYGRAKGRKERALQDALMLLEDGMVTRSYIHEKLGITEDELQEALDAKKSQTPPE
jgi:hypothetical protein